MLSNIYQEAQKLAEKIRRELKLGNAPIKDIFSLLEGQGIFVVRMPIDGDGLSGAFYFDREKKSAKMLINSNRSKGHQNFTAAHEFCHFMLDKDKGIIVDDDQTQKSSIEKRADSFAANFLLPVDGVNYYIQEILKQKNRILNDETLAVVRNEFGVSWGALIYRLHDLDYSFDMNYREKIRYTSVLNSLSIQMGLETEFSTKNGQLDLSRDFQRLAFRAYFKKQISLGRLSEMLRESYEETQEKVVQIQKASDEKISQ